MPNFGADSSKWRTARASSHPAASIIPRMNCSRPPRKGGVDRAHPPAPPPPHPPLAGKPDLRPRPPKGAPGAPLPPPRRVHPPADELLPPLGEARHAAVGVRDQHDRAHAADGD